MSAAEFSHIIKADQLGHGREIVSVAADLVAREALAKRFDLIAIDGLSAKLELWRDGADLRLEGRLTADVVQRCVVTSAPVPAHIKEPVTIRFAALSQELGEEVELDADECDVMDYDGLSVDIGEAVAQSLALALDPFPRADNAESALKTAGIMAEGDVGSAAFGPLAALRDQLARK